ncbi:3-hydroxybutyryl-CoA dehydrogenase [Shimazuella sp. KC615]|uniref:3-hydroxybutyryl-CoA dehydrogenase n=2 Tax=Shimazuella alba TaxID=2690964 RepID=A0A6I4VN98_9BACL|nr:3-hydroxybutyryl-CoA dehydrogenase [Shimazuella alba]
MGQGIAELCASKGYDVLLLEKTDELAQYAKGKIELSLDKKLSKWGITNAEKKMTLSRIIFSSQMDLLGEADFVIESVVEDMDTKKMIFQLCDEVCQKDVLLASNTSTLSLTEIAAATQRPDKVVGLHFVYPVTKRPLVEVVRGLKTSEESVTQLRTLLTSLQLTGVEVFESPGFVTTRMIVLFINEACNILMEGVAEASEIDFAMRNGYHFAYGPFEMADRFGLNSVLAALERLYREFGDAKFRPAPLLKKMVRAGHLGIKTGEGFFQYDKDGNRLLEKRGE